MFSFSGFLRHFGLLLLKVLLLFLPGGAKIQAEHKREDSANKRRFIKAKAMINQRTDDILKQISEKVRKLK